MTPPSTRVGFVVAAAATALLLLLPATVAAHAELDVATPADGATVEGTPEEIAGTFTQTVKSDGSSLILRDAAGGAVARGGLDPDDDHRMLIADVPDLAPGEYEVQWVTISADDDELARGTWSFTVTPAPTPTPTDTPEPSAAPTPTATPEPTAVPTPSASPAPTVPADASGADVILPIVIGLAIVLIAAAVLLSRRGRTPGGA